MEIQAYNPPSSSAEPSTSTAIVVLRNGQEITKEEYEKRLKDAAELEEKLKYITEKVPTRIMNVSGSNAGAGSGEFHMYRMARRREMMRQQRIEEDAREEEKQTAFETRQQELAREEEEKRAKRRAKRQKKKQKKKQRVGDGAGGTGPGQGTASGRANDGAGAQSSSDEELSEGEQEQAMRQPVTDRGQKRGAA